MMTDKMPILRTVDKAYEELKASDPNTPITKSGLRVLMNSGDVDIVSIGRKWFFNMGSLLEYLQGGKPKKRNISVNFDIENEKTKKIRKIG